MVILGVFLIVNMGGMKMIEWLFEMYFGRVVFFIFIFFTSNNLWSVQVRPIENRFQNKKSCWLLFFHS